MVVKVVIQRERERENKHGEYISKIIMRVLNFNNKKVMMLFVYPRPHSNITSKSYTR